MKINFLLFLLLLLGTFNLFAQDEYTLVREGQRAPDFSYKTLEGETAKLSDLKGKVVWITFFATWCGPCRKELPQLEKQLFQNYENHPGFQLLVIGREHSAEELKKFTRETNLHLPFIPDPEREIFSRYASQNIPRNIILDREGTILSSSVGFNEEDFNKKLKMVEALLKQ